MNYNLILDKHAPITKIEFRGNNLPYVTSEMMHLIRTRDHLKKKANPTGSKCIFQATSKSKAKCCLSFESYNQSIIPRRSRRVLVI